MVTERAAAQAPLTKACPLRAPAMSKAVIFIVARPLPWICEILEEAAGRPPACRRCTGCCRRRPPRPGRGRPAHRPRKLATGFFTKVKYAPSPGSNIWLLTPIVVAPPPWEVLIVLLALVKVPSALRTGVLPITTSAVGGVADRAEQVLARGQVVEVEARASAGGGVASTSNV